MQMSIETKAADIREEFSWLEDWEARYAHLIDLGKANPPLAPHERSEDTRVRIDDSTDDREPRFYVRQLLADFDGN